MKRTSRWLWIALVSILIGSALFISALALADFDINTLGTTTYTTATHTITDTYTNIVIDVQTSNITLAPAEDGVCRVECVDIEGHPHTVETEEGTLCISYQETRPWYKRIGINLRSPSVTVYLPRQELERLSIRCDTGNVCVEGFRQDPGEEEDPVFLPFGTVDISVTTGNIRCELSAQSLQIEATTGNVAIRNTYVLMANAVTTTGRVEITDSLIDGMCSVRTTTGNVELRGTHAGAYTLACTTGNIRLSNTVAALRLTATTTTGNIVLDACDARALVLSATTGNVKGTLQSDKVFTVHTDTGRINIPANTGSEPCEITTDTGNIDIQIEP